MTDKLNLSFRTSISGDGDSYGAEILALRDHFKRFNIDYFCSREEVVIKTKRHVFLDLVSESVKKSFEKNSSSSTELKIHTEYTSQEDISISILMDDGNNEGVLCPVRFRVYINVNNNQFDDYYYDEDPINDSLLDGDNQDVLISDIIVVGEVGLCKDFIKIFKSSLKTLQSNEKTSLVKWIFTGYDNGSKERCFSIKKDWLVDSSFYPWIGGDLNEYYKQFMDSKSQILVCYGEPGTGKTTFLRDFICESGLNAFISYDPKILTSDNTFVKYLLSSQFDVVIIEDADELLTSTRGEHNKIISKILNVSDGLIKLPKKKLIFTTNLTDVKNIDTAIIRPGRCFDVLEFRKLNRPEILDVCENMKIDIPPVKEKRDTYSLAELFFIKDVKDSSDPFMRKHGEKLEKKMGFI